MIIRLLYLIIFFLFLIGFIYIYKHVEGLPNYVIPPLSGVAGVLETAWKTLLTNTLYTFGIGAIGHLISLFLAISICGFSTLGKPIKDFVYQFSITWQSYPIIALAPLFFIVFGDGYVTRFLIIITISYFPIFLAIFGVIETPLPEVEYFYENLGRLSGLQRAKIRIMSRLGTLFVSINGAATLAIVGTILAEFLAAERGIGYFIRVALYEHRLDRILAALLAIGIANWLYSGALQMFERIAARRINVERD